MAAPLRDLDSVTRAFRQGADPTAVVRGRGRYVDDMALPGMVFLDLVRSPWAHARIVRIDVHAALNMPGVLAVITGADLDRLGLATMPTLMDDQQMVLPLDTVQYAGQEVAAVVALDRYVAVDAAAAIYVEYEPLPAVVDPGEALRPGAPLVRPDRNQTSNLMWHWEVGDRVATEQAMDGADVVVTQEMYLPRLHSSAIETCGCVARWMRPSGS